VTVNADRLADERACERLMYEYARVVDSGQASKMAELFTEDGTWTAGDGRVLEGREQIRAAFTARQHLARRQSRHVITNLIVDVHSENEASGICYLVNFRHDSATGTAEKPAPAAAPKFVGDYHLTFRRDAGNWRIASLRFDLAFLRRSGSGPG
jgi:uncharacterized protein (TIGR02246 family)